MKSAQLSKNKIYAIDELLKKVNAWKLLGKKIVFTNGVFDLLHEGHISSLQEAASYGDILIVGLNADASVKKIKGPNRPIYAENARATLLAALLCTDAVVIFEENTPEELIKLILPDILVKGGDYTIDQIAGAKEVLENGGQVILASMIKGISTTQNIENITNHK